MAKIPSTVAKRLITKVPKFKKILAKAKADDINEADTVAIVADMLEEIFGFDKYEEITREYEIKGTFCDLAIKTNKKIDYLIEAKAIGINLKDIHLKQAINYAANEGIKWVVLTNGINWQVHCVTLKFKTSVFASFNSILLRRYFPSWFLVVFCPTTSTSKYLGS